MAKPTILPIWNTDETNSVEPDAAHKLDGWAAPGGIPEKPPFQNFNFWQNAVWKWLNEINIKGILGYDVLTDYVALFSSAVGSDGNLYICAINNGPTSSVVNPVGDLTGTWKIFYLNTSANVATGTANAIVLNAISGVNPTALFDGQVFSFKASATNTGATTIKIGSLAIKSLTLGAGTALLGGEIIINTYSKIAYNKTSDRFEMAVLDTTAFAASGINSDIVELTGLTTPLSLAQGGSGSSGDSIIKAWINFDGTGTIAIGDSFNVASITDDGVGVYTITWDTDFANNSYAISIAAEQTGPRVINNISTGSCQVTIYESTPTPVDSTDICILAIGDQ